MVSMQLLIFVSMHYLCMVTIPSFAGELLSLLYPGGLYGECRRFVLVLKQVPGDDLIAARRCKLGALPLVHNGKPDSSDSDSQEELSDSSQI